MISARRSTTQLPNQYPPVHQWPARSTELTSLDSLWRYAKIIVFKSKPLDSTDLRKRITLLIRSVTPEMWNVTRKFYVRL